jgi:tetratricopeptide (TPR) repeat protein
LWANDFEEGNDALRKGEYDRAIACFTAWIREHPQHGTAYYNRGNAYSRKKAVAEAIADYSEAIHLDPKNPLPYNNRGNAYRARREYDKAIEDYSEAIHLNPGDALAHNNRGCAHGNKKEYDNAIEDFEKAIRLNPFYAAPHNNLAWLLATCSKDSVRDGKRALELATKACELTNWEDPPMLDTLAAANAETSNFEEAVKWVKKALDLDDDTDKAEEHRRQLRLYRDKKPYRVE